MSARNLHDQVDDLKNKLLYGSVAITVYSCPLNFFPKLSFNKAWSLIGDFMWWYVMPFCILFILKNYLVIAMDKTQDLVEPQFIATSYTIWVIYQWSMSMDPLILIIDLIFDTFKYSKMYQVNDNVNNTKVCLRHLKVYKIRLIFVNLIRCSMINTWHRQLDSFIIPAGSQINKIIPFP